MIKMKQVVKVGRVKLDRVYLCISLDPDLERMPLRAVPGMGAEKHRRFLDEIISSTSSLVSMYKFNVAFFEKYGWMGMKLLQDICDQIKKRSKQFIILDANKGTNLIAANRVSAEFAFDLCHADAVTVRYTNNSKFLAPFIERVDKYVLIDFRFGIRRLLQTRDEVSLWNEKGNVGLAVQAADPDISLIGETTKTMPLLVDMNGERLSLSVTAASLQRYPGPRIFCTSQVIFASKGDDYSNAAHQATVDWKKQLALLFPKK